MAKYQTTFYGKKHICSYCGTQFNEDECPNCCSTQFEKTRERILWEEEQKQLEKEINLSHAASDHRYAQKSRNRFLTIFFIFFASIWIIVLSSFFLHACAMSQITRILFFI